MHLTSGGKMLASKEYMTRHNNLLKILMVAWYNENELIDEIRLFTKSSGDRELCK